MTNLECLMTNDGADRRFLSDFNQREAGRREIHGAISTLMSIAVLPAVPRFFSAAGFRAADAGHSNSAKAHSIGIEDEDAAIAERDFFGLPAGLVAVLGVQPLEARLTVICRYPFFAEATNGRPSFADTMIGRADVVGQVCKSLLRAKALPDAVLR